VATYELTCRLPPAARLIFSTSSSGRLTVMRFIQISYSAGTAPSGLRTALRKAKKASGAEVAASVLIESQAVGGVWRATTLPFADVPFIGHPLTRAIWAAQRALGAFRASGVRGDRERGRGHRERRRIGHFPFAPREAGR